ncbi:hypothetical protein CYLTODRAFT_384682 [Cylindrobasidium torrendii FP15055 ss-10]|uniref:Uncharacterized protein n=1 Tax=Cylindrobasidium torrendii FP15055 ss-10 TaxID=1314674 RepID=A0A0D7ATN4_9AGAR|nr:hypothetical protein CYLTODRAFT_384682 [Cylindrobasidium torrendii FP15055 ss-10]
MTEASTSRNPISWSPPIRFIPQQSRPALSPSKPPPPPAPHYVMTKAFLHRNDPPPKPIPSSKPKVQPSRPRKRKGGDSADAEQSSSSLSSQAPAPTKPIQSLPRRMPFIEVEIGGTSAPNTLPMLPLPPATLAIPSIDNSDTVEPPKKKQKTRSADARVRRRRTQHAKRDAQPRIRGLKDVWIKHLAKTKVLILENFDIEDAPCGTGGWQGSSRRVYRSPHTLQGALEEGFKELEWDGLVTLAILDCKRRLIMLFQKRDMSEAGLARQARMTKKLEEAARQAHLGPKTPGKGDFYATREGIVHSGGTDIPGRVRNGEGNRKIMQQLLDDPDFVFEARQSDITFRMYNPDMHSTYWDIRETLTLQPDTEHLKWNFDQLPFALTTFNFGPQTVCETHIDNTDNAYGWAPIRSYGPYNYKKGGHIVFPSLKLLVQFPPGAKGWFPTALFPHANTLIGENEKRYLVTSYNSGALLAWVYWGGNTKRGWLAYLKKYSKTQDKAALDV